MESYKLEKAQRKEFRKKYKSFLRPYIKKFYPHIVLMFLISLSYGVVQIAAAYYSKPLIDYILSGQKGFNYLFILSPSLFILSAFSNFLTNFSVNVFAYKTAMMVKLDLLNHITNEPSITDKETKSSLINVLTNDSATVVLGALAFLPWTLSGAMTIIATLFLMFYYSWIVGLITITTFPLFLAISIIFSSKEGTAQQLTSKAAAEVKNVTLSGIDGAYYIKRMNAKSYILKNLVTQIKPHRKSFLSTRFYNNVYNSMAMFLLSLFPLTMFAISLATALSGFGSISNSMLLFTLASTILLPLQFMQNSIGLKIKSYKMYQRVSLINDYICPKKEGKNMDSQVKIDKIDNLNVSINAFKYSQLNYNLAPKTNEPNEMDSADKDEKKLLCDFSLTLKSGEFGVIMGESGSGKSTLLKFLSCEQILPLECGSIKINGTDLKDIDENSYFGCMQYVPQANFLFKDTLKGNLSLGQKYSDEELIKACDIAVLGDFLAEYTLSREIDAGSKNISGGQLQRICLARAFLRKPSLLILDEPTSALDAQTSMKLIKNLKEYSKQHNCCVLIVTHSQDVADAADKIVKL